MSRTRPSQYFGVYPRVGGGTASKGVDQVGVMGLSPRGRGNPGTRGRDVDNRGVYPRVGGGTLFATNHLDWPMGLSPRGRGNP